MKTLAHRLVPLLLTLAALAAPTLLRAHGEDHAPPAATHAGRLFEAGEQHWELLVLADRRVQIARLDAHGKLLAPGTWLLTLTTGDRAAPTRLSFAERDGLLVSTEPLPAGENLPAVIRVAAGEDAAADYARLQLNLAHCPGCDREEYRCTCGH